MRAVACLCFIIGLAAGKASAQNPSDQPVTLDAPGGDVQPVTGEDQHQLSITGFGVGGYTLRRQDRTTTRSRPARSRWRCSAS